MKIFIAATALSLAAGAAFAGEGNGNPFPFTAPPISVTMQGYKPAPGVSQNPFPYTVAGRVMPNSQVLPSEGSEGVVQSANSLPVGFEDGAAGLANLNNNAATPTHLAQPTAPVARTHG